MRSSWMLCAISLSCSHAIGTSPDANEDSDAGPAWVDSGSPTFDAGSLDAGPMDAGSMDAGSMDAGLCPVDMVWLQEADAGSFCIDRYEAPNQPGASPLYFVTAPEGSSWCAGMNKRLCTESEWVRACMGLNGDPYPYGTSYQAGRCTDDKTWISPDWAALSTWPADASVQEAARLYQADPSGSRAGCVTDAGVFDLTGNVAEWVERSFPNVNNYDQVMKGCYWAGCYGGAPPNCAFVNPAHPGTFRTYEAGFRCCLSLP
jgi:formylglycine-generating enzyme required for sulfatase activity